MIERVRTQTRTATGSTDAPPAAGPPLFLVGCGRSGTTMLRGMLNAHPELAIPPESHFIPALWRVRGRFERGGTLDTRRMARAITRSSRFTQWEVPRELLERRIASARGGGFVEVVSAAFMAYADAHGKVRWGDKTPNYALDVALLAHIFPDARFVHLVRDGRDVALSLVEVPWWPWRLSEAAEVWARWAGCARADGRALGDRYIEIRYERLVAEPERVLREVCTFAGLGYRPSMLGAGREAQGIAEHKKTYHRHAGEAPAKGLRDWRRDMAPRDVAMFEAVAGGALEAFGYPRAHERLPLGTRLRARGAVVRNGTARAVHAARLRAALAVRRDALPQPRRW